MTMVRKMTMVLLGTVVLVAGSGAAVRAQTTEIVVPPMANTDSGTADSQSEDLQKAQAQCAEDGGWFDPAAGVCNEPSE
jgi:hypothetical protein